MGFQERVDLLRVIDDFWDEHGYAPNYRELMEIMDIDSLSKVHSLVWEQIKLGNLLYGEGPGGKVLPRTLRVFRGE